MRIKMQTIRRVEPSMIKSLHLLRFQIVRVAQMTRRRGERIKMTLRTHIQESWSKLKIKSQDRSRGGEAKKATFPIVASIRSNLKTVSFMSFTGVEVKSIKRPIAVTGTTTMRLRQRQTSRNK